jgi:hypothetical protein
MPSINLTDLQNAKLDVDHIDEVTNSAELTATNRHGVVKETVAGALYKIQGINNRGAWASVTAYASKDIVSIGGIWYICVVAHTSSALFATDSASKWRVYQGVTTGDLSASSGATLIGFLRNSVGSVLRTLLAKLFDLPPTPQDFGAVVDGVTLASATIQAAFDSVSGFGTVDIPAGVYNLGTTGVVCPYNVSIRAATGAEFLYSGSGTALKIEGQAFSTLRGRSMVLPVVRRSPLQPPGWYSGTDSTSIGVHLVDVSHDDIYFPAVLSFATGIKLEAVAYNVFLNTFRLGRIANNKKGVDFLAGVGWGVNQNTFIGGGIRIDSAYTMVGCYKLYMPGVEANGNTFVGVDLERGASELAIYCESSGNVWVNCRFESGTTIPGFITFTPTATGNQIHGGGGALVNTAPFVSWIVDNGFANFYHLGTIMGGKYFRWDLNNVKALLLGNGSVNPAYPISGYGTDRLQLGDATAKGGVRHYGPMQQEEVIITSGGTLTVGANHYQLNYATPTTVNAINTGLADQTVSGIVSVTDINGNITISHAVAPAAASGRFVNKSAASKVLTAYQPVFYVAVNGNFYEV